MLEHTGMQGRSIVQASKGKSSALDCTHKRAVVAQYLSLTTSVFQAYISMQVQAKQRKDSYEVSTERRGRTVVLLAVALREAHLDQQLVHLVAPLLLPGAQAHRHVAAVDDALVHAPVPHQREAEVRHRPMRRKRLLRSCLKQERSYLVVQWHHVSVLLLKAHTSYPDRQASVGCQAIICPSQVQTFPQASWVWPKVGSSASQEAVSATGPILCVRDPARGMKRDF